jgi:hypothetical protein
VRHLSRIAQRHDQIAVGEEKTGIEADRSPKVRDGLSEFALGFERVADIVPRWRITRLEPKRFPIFPQRFIQPAGLPVDIAEIVVRLGEVGILAQRFCPVEHRFVHPVKIEQKPTEIIMRDGGIHPRRDNGAVSPDGLVDLAEQPVDIAKAGLGFWALRLQRESALKGLLRLLKAPGLGQHDAEVAMKFGDIAFQADRLAYQPNSGFGVVGLMRDLAKHVKAVGVSGIGRQNRGIKLFGFGKPPGFVVIARMMMEFGVLDPGFQCGR